MNKTEKSPCPQGSGPGGRGHRTEHKYINIKMSGGSRCFEEKCSGVRGQSDGRDCFRQSRSETVTWGPRVEGKEEEACGIWEDLSG